MLFDRLCDETRLARAESVSALGDRASRLRLPTPEKPYDWPRELSSLLADHRMLAPRDIGRSPGRPACPENRFQHLMQSALADCSDRLATCHSRCAYLGFLFSIETCRLGCRLSSSPHDPELLSLRRLYAAAERHIEDEETVRAYAFFTLDLIRSCAAAAQDIVGSMARAGELVPSNDR